MSKFRYGQIFWNLEGGSGGAGGGADPGAGGGDGGKPGGGAPGAGGAPAGGAPGGDTPLRVQLAQRLGEQGDGFRKWAEKYTTDDEWLKSVEHMRSNFDNRVPLPGADSKPEDWDKFYQRIGKPASSKDYKFDWGETKLDDTATARFEAAKEFAHKNNFTQAQFEAMIGLHNELTGQDEEMIAGQLDSYQAKAIEGLRRDWGADFEANAEYAIEAGRQLADNYDEFKAFVDMSIIGKDGAMRVGDHPAYMKLMAKVGRLFAEDARAQNFERTGEAEAVRNKITELEERARKENVPTWKEPYHSQLTALYAKLHPQKQKAGPRG